jgi:predicted nuclease of restriction endonuclease-like RecB superfamily
MEGVNILTNTDFGVYVDGAEEVIDMYEKGELSSQDLYNAILDLEVVYKSKNVESSGE